MSSPSTILLAEDDASLATVLKTAFSRKGYAVKHAPRAEPLLEWIEEGLGDVVITDVMMPGLNGLDALSKAKAARPELPVIVISAQNTLMTAVESSVRGAYDYLPKPFDLDVLMERVERSLTNKPGKTQVLDDWGDASIVGASGAMQEVYRIIARMTQVELTVLISGESGSGKELVARSIHHLSKRKDKPFVAVNMAAIPRELVESELFGHEKGAFTGASARKSGTFEQAEGGTLFLDEIGDMPLEAQTRLLRVLQQGEFTTVGGAKPIKANVRVIGATHRDLQQLVREGSFREDLYFRLNVVPVRVPSLRERKDDIPELTHFLLQKGVKRGLPSKEIEKQAVAVLAEYHWPGNVRELENVLFRLMALVPDTLIRATDVRAELKRLAPPVSGAQLSGCLQDDVRAHLDRYFAGHATQMPPPGLHERIVSLVEKPLIELTLKACGNNQIKAAHVLGINRNTLRKKMRELGLKS